MRKRSSLSPISRHQLMTLRPALTLLHGRRLLCEAREKKNFLSMLHHANCCSCASNCQMLQQSRPPKHAFDAFMQARNSSYRLRFDVETSSLLVFFYPRKKEIPRKQFSSTSFYTHKRSKESVHKIFWQVYIQKMYKDNNGSRALVYIHVSDQMEIWRLFLHNTQNRSWLAEGE